MSDDPLRAAGLDPTPRRRAGDGVLPALDIERPGRAARQPAPEFNGAASWYAMTFSERRALCKLAGFARAFDVASKHFHALGAGERELIRATVRQYRDLLPESSWGLA
jgi:hypothetical protein